MLTLLLGVDWRANRARVLDQLAQDVAAQKGGRILMVPESISHDMERRLCMAAGDTASRFAEVLSFPRLADRVRDSAAHGNCECMDNGGRVVAMASAAVQLHSKLKAYAAVETRPEFLISLVEAVDEFKRCCISSADLRQAALQTQGSLAQKLEELSLLLEAYDSLCARGKRDPRDQMSWLLEQLEDSSFASERVFYIDGFPDFTRQHMAILEHLIMHSPHVVISLNCDRPGSDAPAFINAGETASQLLRFAKGANIPMQIQHVEVQPSPLQNASGLLFQGQITPQYAFSECISTYTCESVAAECEAAAEHILELVRSGSRYRDIGVVCTDMSVYRNALRLCFSRCQIPVYIAGTEDILDMPVINTALAALEAALNGLEQRDVLRYLKSALSPLELAECDEVENYAILWNITGSRWKETWSNHPDGLGEQMDAYAENKLKRLNAARRLTLDPLITLQTEFRDAKTLCQQVLALYDFLERIGLNKRLKRLAQQLDDAGDNAGAQVLDQLWEILLSALEQLHDVLGETAWDPDTFTRLLKLLLSQYNVGTIPPVLDAVTAGPVDAMRCLQTKHLFVLGAAEGSFPHYSGSSGVLTDQERTLLRQLGVPLMGGSLQGLHTEFSNIYGVFCGAEESVRVYCPSGQPSFLFKRLEALSGSVLEVKTASGFMQVNEEEAGAWLVRCGRRDTAAELGIAPVYDRLRSRVEHSLGCISPSGVEGLYGSCLNLSASQVDKQADCRLAYFLKYGMRARERRSASIDPAEFGTYVHAVLEQTARRIKELGGFKEVSLEDTLTLANQYSEEYAKQQFSQLDSDRLTYLFHRNSQELEMVVIELWQELQQSDFEPMDFEVSFGDNGKMPPIQIPGHKMQAQLRGFVDRVDVWKADTGNFFRVVDYKTGKKDFDYCDVFNGLGLQMLLYLFALEDGGEDVVGEKPISAGVQYFPARVPYLSADALLSEEEAQAVRQREWKRKGLLLNDETVLHAMEHDGAAKRLSVTRRKDGTVTGDLADAQQLKLLKAYVFTLLGKMVDDIASGCVEPNPYTRGSSHNACAFCPYGAVCHPNDVEGRRNYKTMTAQRFWEELEREMNKHG